LKPAWKDHKKLNIGIGDGDFPCSGRGELSVPTTDLARALKRVIHMMNIQRKVKIVNIDEYNTTKCCHRCGTIMTKLTTSHGKECLRYILPLENLVNLKKLDLFGADIKDITPIAKCTALTDLNLGDCYKIESLDALRALHSLESLNLGVSENEKITDVSPLSACLDLKNLTISCKNLKDLAPLSSLVKLEMLNLGGDLIDKIHPLSYLTALHTLVTTCLQIENIDQLSACTALSYRHRVVLKRQCVESTFLFLGGKHVL
jgi:Leucine-rich repeat (LRR) protein